MTLRLETSAALRERRLDRLLAERGLHRDDARLAELVEDAALVGSLALAGIRVSWDEARASRGAGAAAGPAQLDALRRARAAVAAAAPVTLDAILAWHEALAGPVGLRRHEPDGSEAGRAEADPLRGAPAAFVATRLASLVDWLEAEGSRALQPEGKAAVALARLVEIRPFDDGNGRVSRLLAAHLMARGGLPPPVLVEGDAARLRQALHAAFELETSPLVELLREASGRALDVMLQALEQRLV